MQEKIIQARELAAAEARMPRWMAALALAGALTILLAGFPSAALGFSLGALCGILNYCWLHQAVVALMNTENARVPKRTVAKMLVRYPLSFGGIFLFYKTGWVPIMAVMAGLLVPGAAVFLESLILVGAGFRQREVAE